MLWQLIFLSVLCWFFFVTRRNKRMVLLYKQIASNTPQLPIIGHTYKYLGSDENKMKAFQMHGEETTRRGGLLGLWHTNVLYIMTTDAVAIECITKHCLEKDDLLRVMRVVTGNGSVFATVPIWRPRRKVLAPTFSPKNINGFVDIFTKQSTVMTDKLKSVPNKSSVSMWEYFNTYAMDSICETTMGVDVGTQKNPDNAFLKALGELFHIAVTRMCKPWLHSDFVFTKTWTYSKVLQYKELVCGFVDKIIAEKRKTTKEQVLDQKVKQKESLKTFIDMMIESSGNDQGYTNLELREEALVLIIAGTDTSAVGTAFTSVLLSRYPDIQEKVYQEIQEVFGDSDRPLVAEDLPHLKYLEAVIKETLRMYPPVPIIARKVERDLTLPSGVTLVKGCGVFINIWGVHRNPRYWGPDAEEFRPERFFDTAPKHPNAFMPFSCGPRSCLGYQYALMSIKTTIANLLRLYRVLPAPDPTTGKIPLKEKRLRIKYDIMMRHVDDYIVQLESRY